MGDLLNSACYRAISCQSQAACLARATMPLRIYDVALLTCLYAKCKLKSIFYLYANTLLCILDQIINFK